MSEMVVNTALARIRAEMKRQRCTEEDVANLMDVHRSTARRYLHGETPMPADLLFQVTDFLKLSLSDLVAPAQPHSALLRSSRSDLEGEAFYKRTLNRFRFYGKAVRAMGDTPRMELPSWHDVAPDDKEGIARIASEVRVLLGLPERGPILSMFQPVGHAVKVLEFDADEHDGCDGFVVTSPEFGVGVAIRRGLHLERKRATLAHELGHVVLHADQLVELGSAPVTMRGQKNRDPRENAAWTFAANFLLPSESLSDYVRHLTKRTNKKHEVSRFVLIQLKHDFGLSAALTLVRLREEKLVTAEQYRVLKAEFYPEGQDKEEERFPLSAAQCETHGTLQSAFERLLAVRYFEEGDLSESRLAELLDLPEDQVIRWIDQQAPMFSEPADLTSLEVDRSTAVG